MGYMFYDAEAFNQPLDKWDVSKVTFHYYFAYECPINGTSKMPKFK